MTQTLTTETIKLWRSNAEITLGETDELDPENNAAKAILALTAELLANREAQPVAWTSQRALDTKCKIVAFTDDMSAMEHGVANDWKDIVELYTSPPAPAVPEVISTRQAIANMERHELCGSINVAYKHGWNDFRAAMLAQPVSQGGKLNSPEIPDGCQWTFDEHDSKWDSGCGEAWMFCDGGPTENGVKFCQSCGKPVLLAAAPEGGNG